MGQVAPHGRGSHAGHHRELGRRHGPLAALRQGEQGPVVDGEAGHRCRRYVAGAGFSARNAETLGAHTWAPQVPRAEQARATGRRAAAAGEAVARSAGLGEATCQVAVDVLLAQPVGAANPHRGKLATGDQAVHRHVRDTQQPRYLRDGQELRLRVANCQWYHPSPPPGSLRISASPGKGAADRAAWSCPAATRCSSRHVRSLANAPSPHRLPR